MMCTYIRSGFNAAPQLSLKFRTILVVVRTAQAGTPVEFASETDEAGKAKAVGVTESLRSAVCVSARQPASETLYSRARAHSLLPATAKLPPEEWASCASEL